MGTSWRRAAVLAGALCLLTPAGSALAAGSTDEQRPPAARAVAAAPAVPSRLPAGLQIGRGAPAAPTGLTATAWLVADLDTGEVLAAQDAHASLAPASTLKVLTAVSLLPVVPPDRVVVPTQAHIDVEGSKVGLLRIPYRAEELYASLLMVSGNDAANALAGAAGGQERAAATMNATAAALGAADTRAVNPHGLDADGQVSTPYDLAVVGRAALAEPDIARWVSTRRSTMPAGDGRPRFEIDNKNKLLGSYEGALGVKNGYTSRAGASFIGAAERDGRRLVVTLMKAEPKVWAEAAVLLDWGFAAVEAGAAPVGALPPLREPEPEPEPAAESIAAERTASQAAVQLPGRQLASALLVAAAVVVVRPGRRRSSRTA
ncbi:MAG TPA: hypothetical protein VM433_02580 [Mycobacteriales bacterium]|nr:hypothetical protein [Mycobacteriales bacterium]